ncbi:hypothetical protein AAG570_005174 [Ranatra chinensis]|uniref:Basement membrane-specific heparan sulfate proteoglycan core protein n=1 Tax=Ranatra chinensis TaxID=642074 RepID=A0ABD0XZN3_9HEMI
MERGLGWDVKMQMSTANVAISVVKCVVMLEVNVFGDECDECRPGTFNLLESNPEGCSQCFCSGVTTYCKPSNMYIEQIPVLIIDESHGFTLTDSNRSEVIRDGFDLNHAMNEIGYDLSNRGGHRFFWSLPSQFTGDKVTSYGGKLTFTQRFSGSYDTTPTRDMDIIISGNGISLFTSHDDTMRANEAKNFVVHFTEDKWRRLDARSGQPRASREDLMTVLSNIDSILVRASLSPDSSMTFLSDVTMDTAVPQRTGVPATQVEVCRCPPQYKGTSCELCADHYYKDFDRMCKSCPCSNNEESCSLGPDYRVKCICRQGYSGDACQHSDDPDDLIVELIPRRVQVPDQTSITFNCSYRGSPKNERETEEEKEDEQELVVEMDTVFRTTHLGNKKFAEDKEYKQLKNGKLWDVTILPGLKFVTCTVKDAQGNTLAFVRSEIIPGLKVIKEYCGKDPEENFSTTAIPPPRPTIKVTISDPRIQIVEAGSTVRFRCSATTLQGRPLQVRWSREGSVLPPNRVVDDRKGLLVIMQSRESDSGVYVCTATDGYTSHSDTGMLTVGGSRYTSPEVRIVPPSVDVREGDPVDIRCEATGNPTPSMIWRRTNNATMNPQNVSLALQPQLSLMFHQGVSQASQERRFNCIAVQYLHIATTEGNRPLPYKATQRDGTLTIADSTVSDSGVYICSAMDTSTGSKLGEVSVMVDVQVYRRPPTVKLEPEGQTVAQGSRAELRCMVTGTSPGDRPRIRWIKANDQMPSYVHTTDTTLVIQSVQPSDRGVYACIVETSGGSAQASAIIEVERREPPSVELYPSTQQILSEGNSALLQCRVVAGIPTPNLYWSRANNASLPYSVQQLHNGVLKFNSVRASDAGEYICHAENSAGVVTMTAIVIVHRVPEVEVTPQGSVTLMQGETLRLKCTASGEPQPTVTWIKPSRTTIYSSHGAGHTEDRYPEAEYEVYSVSREDEGTYTCVAENKAGRTEARVQVMINDNEVSYPHRGDIPAEREPPEVTTSDREFSVPLGGNSEMVCSPQGWDERGVRLEWRRRDGRPLGPDVEQRGRVLYLRNVQRSAEGEYSCVGVQEGTNAVLFSHGWRLRVGAPPRITLDPTRQVVRPGENAYVYCSVDGDQPIETTWKAIGRTLPTSVTVSGGYLQFRGITDSDAGKYMCRASNRVGEAEAVAEVIVKERETRRPVVTVVERNQNVFEGSNVMLQCTTSVPVELEWTREGGDLPVNAVVDGNNLRLEYVRPEDSGRYFCRTKPSWTGGLQGSDYVDLYVTRIVILLNGMDTTPRSTADMSLKIQPSIDVIRVGDNVDLRCVARGLPASQVLWSKLNDRLPSNIQVSTNLLR